MDELLIMFKNVLIFILLAVPGYILVKTKILTAKDSNILSKIVIYLGLPFMIFSSMLDMNFDGEIIIQMLIAVLITIVGLIGTFILSKPLVRPERDKMQKGITRFSLVFPNNGLIGLPLVLALFSTTNPLIVTLAAVCNIITNEIVIIMGSYAISCDKKHISFKGILTNAVFIAFVVGAILNLTNVGVYVPQIATYSQHLKNLVVPLSMMIIGMKFAEMDVKSLFAEKLLYYISFVRLILFPTLIVVILIVLKLILPISNELIIAAFMAFSMPVAGLAPTFADNFGIESKKAVIYVLGTTLFSVITIPVLYAVLNIIL